MNCDKDNVSNLDAINNDDIVSKENRSSSEIDATHHIHLIWKKKRSCPTLRKAQVSKFLFAKKQKIMRMRYQQHSSRNAQEPRWIKNNNKVPKARRTKAQALLAKKQKIMRMRRQQHSSMNAQEIQWMKKHNVLKARRTKDQGILTQLHSSGIGVSTVVSDESADEDKPTLILSDESNHTTQMKTLVNNHTSLSMTDKTPNHSLEEGFDVNQDDGDVLNDIIVLNSHHTINMITEGLDNSMTDKIADDSLEPNAEGQPNETMPFHMIRNKSFLLSHYNCCDPPADSKPFPSHDDFVNLLEGKRQLMYECLRTFYFPNKQLISVSKGMSGYKINAKAYENNATLEDVSQDFHDRFNFKDFHVYEKWNNSYGFKLCPTRNLKRLDKEGHEQWKKEEKEIISFMKKKSTEFNTYRQNNSFEKIWSEPPVKLCSDLIRGKWQKAWNLMADGDLSTNAYITTASIYKLFGNMKSQNMIQKGVKILDIGSSYGSLLWYTANYLKEFKPILVGYEYSLLRHLWGSKCSKELLEEATKYDTCPLHSYQVHLIHQDLLHTNELGRGIDIAFQFDKAFVIELSLHTMFCVMNTESVSYFVTCKANNRLTGWYQNIVQATECFKKVLTVKGCKMNDGESSGDFHVYKKTKTISVTTEYIKTFLAEKATAIDNSIVDEVALTWEEAKSLGPDMVFNKTYNIDEMKKRYCKAAEDAWNVLDVQSQVQRMCHMKSKSPRTCISATENIRCCDNACVTCFRKYPTEKDAAMMLHSQMIDKEKGCGIFATKTIKKDQFLLEYKGRVVPSTVTGEYVAQRGTYRIDGQYSNGLAKCINHSCAPNAVLELVYVEQETDRGKQKRSGRHSEDLQLWIVSKTNILEGEEITIDYGPDFNITKCLCCKCMSKNGQIVTSPPK